MCISLLPHALYPLQSAEPREARRTTTKKTRPFADHLSRLTTLPIPLLCAVRRHAPVHTPMMAETSSFDAKARNGHAEVHSPRPRKPNRIDLLKPQLADDVFNKDGTLKEPGSGISRYCSGSPVYANMRYSHHVRSSIANLSPVGERHPFPMTPHLPSRLRRLRAGRSAPSRSSACSLETST